MSWKKLGCIFENNGISEHLLSHASNPLILDLDKNIVRVFFSGRSADNRSSVGFFDFDLTKLIVLNTCTKPIATYGAEGSYYSHGISIGCSYTINKKQFVLFMGWQVNDNSHWRGDIGRFRISANGEWKLIPTNEFFKCDQSFDKISLSYPWILKEEDSYKMWYGSTLDWTSPNSEMIHVINAASSINGHEWNRKGLALPYEIGFAQAFSRPCVIKDNEGYHMWFSYRSGDGTPYRIGYANSVCGEQWTLALNETGIDVSKKGWDSEMICYPYVFDYNNQRYMMYNGNGYGKTGIGLAIWKC